MLQQAADVLPRWCEGATRQAFTPHEEVVILRILIQEVAEARSAGAVQVRRPGLPVDCAGGPSKPGRGMRRREGDVALPAPGK
jgi:hypothetical protein